MKSGCYPDTINPINLEALRAIGFRIGDNYKSHWPPTFQENSAFAQSQEIRFKWTLKQNAYWQTSVDRFFSTPWKDETKWNNEYSPRNGLIASLSATKAAAETLHWSDITFAMWEAITAYVQKDIKDLRFIASHSIKHPPTQNIINQLVQRKPGEVKIYGHGTDAFNALLGTPMGAGAVYLLMQHKRQLGHKVLIKATVFGKSQVQWVVNGPDVVFEVGYVDRGRVRESGNETAAVEEEGLASLCLSLSGLGNATIEQL
ncbi:MAG: hypothetical protein Q9169_008099 [Polycauliona sp. 2 TL-2023]